MILMKFKTDWCEGCVWMDAMLNGVIVPYPTVTVDIDKSPDVAAKWGVTKIPTLLLVYGDTVVAKAAGTMPKEDVLVFLEEGKKFNETR